MRQPARFLHVQRPPQRFLVVRQLDDEGAAQRVLQPLGEQEGDEVAEVQRVGRRAAPRVQINGLLLFHSVQHGAQVAVGEEDAAAEEGVGGVAGDALEAGGGGQGACVGG